MSSANSEIIIFAGPCREAAVATLGSEPLEVEWRPPVRRGDIDQLHRTSASPRTIAIADGYFHQCMSVGHAELREAIREGWTVWGMSSMGAIRAYEMRNEGMKGFGAVFREFFAHDDFRDDEVAHLHENDAPYRSFSEPLVHLRVALSDFVRRSLLLPSDAERITADLASTWFGGRTLLAFRETVGASARPGCQREVLSLCDRFEQYRIKSLDLAQFLRERPWLHSR